MAKFRIGVDAGQYLVFVFWHIVCFDIRMNEVGGANGVMVNDTKKN